MRRTKNTWISAPTLPSSVSEAWSAARELAEADGVGEEIMVHWNIHTAARLCTVGLQIQKEMLQERIISFVVERCETSDMRKPGCCYVDACVLYDTAPDTHLAFVPKSPANNVYVRIPQALMDPVLISAQAELQTFYSQTFWCNLDVFLCCQAAQALAKRGENLDRCFIGLGPGGVGQSLYSAHLAAMYGRLHAFFDPNIWYHDDELRKQIEQLVGCIILTAQEAPESGRKLREDLYKKTMSADGIAGRKPYGITTRMLELVGWKRMEVNKLMRFTGVTDGNFPSILRRSFVWKPKARFLDATYFAKHYPDHERDGIFPKKETMKKFLVSGPAIAAGLRIQHGFEINHGRGECHAMIENYAALGGDGGLTEDSMRLTCGVKMRERVSDVAPGGADLLVVESQDDAVHEADKFGLVVQSVLEECLLKKKESFTMGMFKYLPLPTGCPNLDRESTWRQLCERQLMVPIEIQGRKGKDAMMPVIPTRAALKDVADISCQSANLTFPKRTTSNASGATLMGHPAAHTTSRSSARISSRTSKTSRRRSMGNAATRKRHSSSRCKAWRGSSGLVRTSHAASPQHCQISRALPLPVRRNDGGCVAPRLPIPWKTRARRIRRLLSRN